MYYKSLFLFACLFILSSLSPAHGQVSVSDNEQGPSLKILSWNIQMLPLTLRKIWQFERAEYIAECLNFSDYDVIVFQEAFDDNVRGKLSQYLQDCFPYQEGPANEKGIFLRMNSGIWIVSKYPLKNPAEVQYNNCRGADCFSRKGALLVEVEKEGKSVQLAGTHLQSGDGKMNAKVRTKQYRQLEDELLSPCSKEGITQIICGDFNTKKTDDGYYEIMLNTLKADDYALEGEQQFSYDGSLNDMISDKSEVSLLDYIFLKNSKNRYQTATRKIKSFTAKWHKDKRHLSDHFALEITLH